MCEQSLEQSIFDNQPEQLSPKMKIRSGAYAHVCSLCMKFKSFFLVEYPNVSSIIIYYMYLHNCTKANIYFATVNLPFENLKLGPLPFFLIHMHVYLHSSRDYTNPYLPVAPSAIDIAGQVIEIDEF